MIRSILLTILLFSFITLITAYNTTKIDIKGFKKGECKAWGKFKRKFNKTYSTMHEARHRKFIFIQNYRKIQDHNKLYDSNLETFNCTINQFSDLTADEFQKKFTGFETPKEMPQDNGFGLKGFGSGKIVAGHKRVLQDAKVLDSIDWRRTAVTNVKKQGECGSCWSFSAAGALEGQIYVKIRKLMNVSIQYYLDCVKTNLTIGCSGGLMTDAFKFAMTNGVVSDDLYPYSGGESPNGCQKMDVQLPIKVTGYIELTKVSEEDLQKAVSAVGPISVALDARWQSLQFYEYGVYFEPLCTSTDLNHAVLVVGYGTDADLGDYWIVKNSWGNEWGEHGYFRIARNKSNHCGLSTMPSYPIVTSLP